ncbi:MAG TPA: DUF4013 domain-containing protein [Anaerolineales bacterium]|nr:DUF4013 domain-containing protein [Anaerolineales bacterium]
MLNFDFLTKDSDLLKKLLIGSLLALTVIGMIPIMGWALEAIRRNMRETSPVLPDWDDFGKYTLDGLKGLGFFFLWFLPVILPVIGFAVAAIFMPEFFASENDAAAALAIINLCLGVWAMVYSLPMGILAVPALGMLAQDSFKEALNPVNVWKVFKAHPSGFLMAWVFGILASMILSGMGTLLCLIGTYPAFVLTYGLMGQFYGIAYREALEKLTQS